MSLLFPYRPFRTRKPTWPLNGRWDRPKPVINITLLGRNATYVGPALLDTGSDDTVFPEQVAVQVGLGLAHAPPGEAAGVGQVAAPLRYAEVTLRITDGREQREWQARVGFTAARLNRPLLGFAGFFQFFTATFHGDREEVELAVNRLYPGK